MDPATERAPSLATAGGPKTHEHNNILNQFGFKFQEDNQKPTHQQEPNAYDKIPQELKDRPQWVCHKNKIPIDPKTGRRASVSERSTLGTYAEAVAAAPVHDGMGFVFTGEDPYCGIDFDKCYDPGTGRFTDPDAERIIKKLDSYTEFSQSWTGFHTIVRVNSLPEPFRTRPGNFEMYHKGRFFVMTGAHFPGTPCEINNRTKQVAEIQLTTMAPSRSATAAMVDAHVTSPYSEPPPAVYAGGRDDSAIRYAGSWRARGISIEHAKILMKDLHSRFEQPPGDEYTLDDAMKKLHRAYSEYAPPSGTGQAVAGTASVVPSNKAPAPPTMESMKITGDELDTAALSPPCIVRDYLFCDIAALAGPGGTGKTTIVLHELVCIALGRQFYGLSVIQPGWCLLVTAEDPRGVLIARLREIMRAMSLNKTEMQAVMAKVLIWDVTGLPVKLVSASDGNILLNSLADEIIAAYKEKPPVVIVFDPIISFGAGESYINDNEQGIITACRRIIRGLGCCVRLITHTGKQNARGKTIDQYSSRGGSALADGARMVSVLQAWTSGDERNPPPGCTDQEGSSITILARPKLSYAPANQPLIWIRRTGWTFDYFTEIKISSKEQEAVLFNQVERFLAAEVKAGVRHGKSSLETAVPGMKRADARRAISQLLARGRIIEVDLPKGERKNSRKTYLATSANFGEHPKPDQDSTLSNPPGMIAAAYRENIGGNHPPPNFPPGPMSAADIRQTSANMANIDVGRPFIPAPIYSLVEAESRIDVIPKSRS